MNSIEKRINKNLNNIKLPKFDLNNLDKKGYVYMEKKRKLPIMATISTLCVVCLLFIGGLYYNNNYKVTSKVGIDVNPSVELKINQKEKVLEVIANNEDGKKIISDMDLKGSNINVAVNALIGSMVKNGYINELANSILISVENNNNQKAESLRQEILNQINMENISIISQTVNEEKELTDFANQYNISLGKVKIIKQIMTNNNLLTFDQLAELSINELNLILNDNENTTGSASQKAYIGEDKAKEIALNHANVTNITNYKIELDFDDVMVYEIEFKANNKEYDYEINATSGDIIEYEIDDKEYINKSNNSSSNNSTITKDEAKQIALNHANVTNITNYKIELDDNKYEIEFNYNNNEYEYEINATTGKIIKYSIDTNHKEPNPIISKDEAKQIALNHANVTNITNCEIELDDNKYEIEFKYNNKEYSYEINATTGKIIEYEIDTD